MPELQVKKKDGTVEPFLRDKISNGVIKSGGTPEQAEKITVGIEAWAPGVAKEGIVNTSDIRVKVLEALKVENPAAAEQYETYKRLEPTAVAPAVPVEPAPKLPKEPTPAPVEPPVVE